MEQNLIKKIKQLENIEPSAEWMDLTRDELISQIDSDKAGFAGFFQWVKQPQQFALAFSLALIVLAGPWLAIEASKASLPGELLYSVKKMTEGVQITVVPDNNKTQLKVEFASRRLEELSKITENSDKNEKIGQVAVELKNDLAEASAYVNKMPEEEIVAIAKKTNRIKEELDQAKEDASLEVKTELAQAEKAVEQINKQILTVLNKKYQDKIEYTGTTTDQEILTFIRDLEDGTITTTDELINGAE